MSPQPLERKTFLVQIQQRTSERDTLGQTKEIWTTVRREWADITTISGREYFNASGERATVTHRLSIPYSPLHMLRPRDRIVYSGSVFDVKSVIVRDLRTLELLCLEVL